jgi:hypothetical protein
MKIAGIDYSMSSPGICTHWGEKWSFDNCRFFYLTKTKKLADSFFGGTVEGKLSKDFSCSMERYDFISDWAMSKVSFHDHAMIEGYAYAATGRVFDIGENTGILKYKIWNSRIPLKVATPTQIKKFATGSGSATKDSMYASWIAETGVDLMGEMTPRRTNVTSPISDIVDAYYICKYLFYEGGLKIDP